MKAALNVNCLIAS